MALRNALGELALEATLSARFGGDKVVSALRVAAAGDNTVYDPAAGKAVRLLWIGMSSPESGIEVLAIVKLLGPDGITDRYRWNMGAPGAFMHWEPIEGSPNELLRVNLTGGATPVDVNYVLEEF